jgi:uncharacterized protein (UPF0333 family)
VRNAINISSLKNQKGQTTVEYLLLLVVVFVTAYILITGPFATFTRQLIFNVARSVQNVVQSAEFTTEPIVVGNPKHPSSPKRFKPLHL